jgi:hypothetical protein
MLTVAGRWPPQAPEGSAPYGHYAVAAGVPPAVEGGLLPPGPAPGGWMAANLITHHPPLVTVMVQRVLAHSATTVRRQTTAGVPQTSQSAVSRVSQPADRPITGRVRLLNALPVRKSAIQRVGKPAVRTGKTPVRCREAWRTPRHSATDASLRTARSVLECGGPPPLSAVPVVEPQLLHCYLFWPWRAFESIRKVEIMLSG